MVQCKTEDAQGKLLKLSARKGKELRRLNSSDEHVVAAQTRLILVQNKQRHKDQKTALTQKKNDIIRDLRQHRGLRQTPDDADHLLQRFGPQREVMKPDFLGLYMSGLLFDSTWKVAHYVIAADRNR